MHFLPPWTEMRRPQGETFRSPPTVVSAAGKDLRKHCLEKINCDGLGSSDTLERLPLRMDGRGGTHHVLGAVRTCGGS